MPVWLPKKKILIVEDNKNISKLVKYNLEKADFECLVSKTGEESLQLLEEESIDLIVLDIMLHKMDGFEDEWNTIGHRNFCTYTSLPPGD